MFAGIRRIGRIIVFVLLAWTTIDLVDHNLGGFDEAGTPAGAVALVNQDAPDPVSAPSHVDHSFCCSHTVDVRTPFRIALTFREVGLLGAESVAEPCSLAGGLYHPPLARS